MRLLPLLASAAILAPLGAQTTLVVAAWDTFDNNPNYVAGALSLDQTNAVTGQRFGTVFDVLATKGSTSKQATRQSTDGTFGDAVGLVTWDGNPIAATTTESSALRINAAQVFRVDFTNVLGSPVQLGDLLFDWSRSNDTSNFLTVSMIGPDLASTDLFVDTATPNAAQISDYPDFRVDLRGTTIAPGASFSLLFTGTGSGTGGNLDNLALTVVIPEPGTIALFAVGAAALMALRRRRS